MNTGVSVFLVVVVVVGVVVPGEGYQMSRCELVKQLRRQGFPENQLRDWVCLVEAESSRQTHVVNTNKNGSKDYGLFQINDQFWCSNTNKPGKDCSVTCADVIKDDIGKASKCAKLIYNRHKFSAWYGWKSKCQGHALPNISSCK